MPNPSDNLSKRNIFNPDLMMRSGKRKNKAASVFERLKKQTGSEEKRTLEEINRNLEEDTSANKAKKLKIPYINLHGFPISEDVISIIPEEQAKKSETIAFLEQNGIVRLGTINPDNKEINSLLKYIKEKMYKPELFLISESSYKSALEVYKKIIKPAERETNEVELSKQEIVKFQKEITGLTDLKEKIKKVSTTKLIDIIMAGAVKTDASDIHMEPRENEVKLRYRIDGVLQDVTEIPKDVYSQILSRIKLLAELKLNITNVPQDGRFTIKMTDRDIDIRTSVIPSAFGESIVLRLLGMQAKLLKVEDLGLKGKAYEIIKKNLEKPNGMILTTGPTGSGKTTTLYAFLNQVNTPEIKIITLEDPIEYRLENISQTQIESEKGYTFAIGLRSILRQDPDVLMVGEIRDLETAEIAMHAALTGHIVFSTLHTNDAAGIFPRLIDIGVNPSVIAPAINAGIAQRLIRVLCKHCKKEYKPDSTEMEKIKTMFNVENSQIKLPEIKKLYKTKGCEKCNGTGFKGRIGIFEVVEVDKEMEKLIMQSPANAEVFEMAVKSGMITMTQDGILKMIEGVTSLEEVERVT